MANIKKQSEESLIKRMQADDEDAFTEIYHRYHKLVFFVANRSVRNEADAMDIAQETFLEIKRSIHSLRNPSYFRLWVYRIIHSKCNNLFRSNKFSIVDVDGDFVQNIAQEERIEFNPNKQMKFLNDQDVLLHLMDALPYNQKMVLILFYMEQLSIKEIAHIMSTPEGTIKSRMSTAKVSLKQKIENYEESSGIKLTFHSLDQALPMALSAGLTAIQVPSAITAGMSLPHGASHLFGAVATKTAIITTCSVVAVTGGGLAIYSNYQNKQTATPTIAKQAFSPSTFDGKQLNTPKDAYFYLLSKACCKEEIQVMKKEDIETLQPIYTNLKKENGYHYQLLQNSGWKDAFEEKLK